MRRLRLLTAIAAIGVASTVLGMATPAAGVNMLGTYALVPHGVVQAAPTGTFSLYNYNSHECLGIAGGADNAAAIQWDCNKAPDQTWHIGQNSGGTSVYHQIINGDGECLGVYGISTTEGAAIVGWQCLGPTHPDQYWAWVESHSDPGYYYLLNLNSNMVVGVLGNSTTEGTAIVQWADQDTPNNQLWEPASGQSSPPAPSPPPVSSGPGPAYNGLWSGYTTRRLIGAKDLPASADTFVSAKIRVPKVSCQLGQGLLSDSVSFWVGLGGEAYTADPESGDLAQDGIETKCFFGFGTSYEAVYQFVPTDAGVVTIGKTVSAGDTLYMSVDDDGPSPLGLHFSFQLTDYSSKGALKWNWQKTFVSGFPTAYVPDTADWIVESGNSRKTLEYFGAVAFTQCIYEGLNGVNQTPTDATATKFIAGTRTSPLTSVTPILGAAFGVAWLRS